MPWTTPRTWAPDELVTAALLNTHLRDNLSYLNALGQEIYINPLMRPYSHTGFGSVSLDVTALQNGYRWSSGAQNDLINWYVPLQEGTWNLELLYWTSSAYGIYSVQLNDVQKGTIDGYSAATVKNVRSEITSIAVGASGVQKLTLKMATKNASSSAYYGVFVGVKLWRNQ